MSIMHSPLSLVPICRVGGRPVGGISQSCLRVEMNPRRADKTPGILELSNVREGDMIEEPKGGFAVRFLGYQVWLTERKAGTVAPLGCSMELRDDKSVRLQRYLQAKTSCQRHLRL